MATGGRQRLLKAIRAYQDATAEVRALLDEVDQGLGVFAELLESGEPVAALLGGGEASASRRQFVKAMTDFETARRRLRIAVITLGVEQGESMADLARSLGISRQLAYRLQAEDD